MAFDEVTFFELHLHGDPKFAPSITNNTGDDETPSVEMADGGESVETDADGEAAVDAEAGDEVDDADGTEDADGAGDGGRGLGKLLAVVAVLVVVALLVRKLRGGGDDDFEGVDRIDD